MAGYLLEVGSSTGLSNILTTSVLQSSMSTTAPPGTYFLRVKAANACGASAPSSEVFFTIGSSSTFPGSPEDVIATVSGSNVSLSWTAPIRVVRPPATSSKPVRRTGSRTWHVSRSVRQQHSPRAPSSRRGHITCMCAR